MTLHILEDYFTSLLLWSCDCMNQWLLSLSATFKLQNNKIKNSIDCYLSYPEASKSLKRAKVGENKSFNRLLIVNKNYKGIIIYLYMMKESRNWIINPKLIALFCNCVHLYPIWVWDYILNNDAYCVCVVVCMIKKMPRYTHPETFCKIMYATYSTFWHKIYVHFYVTVILIIIVIAHIRFHSVNHYLGIYLQPLLLYRYVFVNEVDSLLVTSNVLGSAFNCILFFLF